MHSAKTRPARRKSVLTLALALGVGLPSPAQGYLLDFTVSLLNPEVFISFAAGSPSRPLPVDSRLKAVDVSRRGDLTSHLSPTHTALNKLSNFPTGPRAAHFSPGASPTCREVFGSLSPQAAIMLQGGIPARNMLDGKASLNDSFATAGAMIPTLGGAPVFCPLAGSHFTDNVNDGLLAHLGIPCQTIDDNFTPGFAARFAAASGAPAGPMVPIGNMLNHLAPFSSTLLLLGSGLMGLVGLRFRKRRG